MIPSKIKRKKEKVTILESKLYVLNIEFRDKNCASGCHNKSNRKLVHVDVDKEVSGSDAKNPVLALLVNKWNEDEITNRGEIEVRINNLNGSIGVGRIYRKLAPP